MNNKERIIELNARIKQIDELLFYFAFDEKGKEYLKGLQAAYQKSITLF